MFPLLVLKGNMIPASQPQIPYCRISCMCGQGSQPVLRPTPPFTLVPRSGKLNKICEREVEMYLER